MRAALWFLALFGVAVAIALFAGNNQAMVTVFWPPHRIDISFNLMVLLLAALFMLLYLASRALSAVFSLPL
ncbi:MAG: heme biosynthesis protein HemY, partial [Polaromonas sp.]